MAKLTEAASLQIVHDNLPPELCLKISGPQVTSSRSNTPAFYFEPSSLEKSYLHSSYLYKNHIYKSKALQHPSLQRIYRWMSVKGGHI